MKQQKWPGNLSEHQVRVLRTVVQLRDRTGADVAVPQLCCGRERAGRDYQAVVTLAERGLLITEGWRIRPTAWGRRVLGFNRFRNLGR